MTTPIEALTRLAANTRYHAQTILDDSDRQDTEAASDEVEALELEAQTIDRCINVVKAVEADTLEDLTQFIARVGYDGQSDLLRFYGLELKNQQKRIGNQRAELQRRNTRFEEYRAALNEVVLRLESLGNELEMPHVKPIAEIARRALSK